MKHFLRLVYMWTALIYIFLLVSPVICIAQEIDTIHINTSTVDFNNPKVGQFVRFHILWDLDYFGIRPESKPTLDSIIRIVKNDSNIKWEFGEHFDCRSSTDHLNDLTEARSRYYYSYAIELGVNSKKISFNGYGKSQLLNDCRCDRLDGDLGIYCTEEEHQQNRRTELKIIAIKD